MSKLRLSGLLNHSFGVWDPTGSLAGAIDDPEEAALAVEALHREGFGEDDLRLFLLPEVVEIRVEVERRQGLLGRVAYSFASLMGAEADAMNHYIDHVRKGGAVVAVRCPEPTAPPEQLRDASGERGDAAVLVLMCHRAHHLRYYGRGHMAHVGW
jgi:hypothetical protein